MSECDGCTRSDCAMRGCVASVVAEYHAPRTTGDGAPVAFQGGGHVALADPTSAARRSAWTVGPEEHAGWPMSCACGYVAGSLPWRDCPLDPSARRAHEYVSSLSGVTRDVDPGGIGVSAIGAAD